MYAYINNSYLCICKRIMQMVGLIFTVIILNKLYVHVRNLKLFAIFIFTESE